MKIKWILWLNKLMNGHLEVLCITSFIISLILLGPMCIIMPIYLLVFGNIYWKTAFTLYFAFYLYDIKSGDRGGRGAGVAWIRGLSVWKHIRNYFPIDLVKTVDLSPDRNYLICVFPHGVLSFGVAGNFCTSYSKWNELFPGLRPKVATLSLNSLMPIARELCLSVGCCSASANALTILLKQSNDPTHTSNQDGATSNAVALLVGGIREQRRCTYPNRYRFVLKNRKGFVRIALQTGASLVPAISFGENDYYDIIESKPGWLKRIFKNAENWPPLYFGRGYFQYNFGILPKRRPITTVIGPPIHLRNIPIPSEEEINEVHELFCKRLVELFEAHKNKYVQNFECVHVEFV